MRTRYTLLVLTTLSFVSTQAQEGLLDNSFSGDGKVVFDNNGHEDIGADIAVRPDGKIWVLGSTYDGVADAESILLMRYNSDGTPDNSFFGDGAEELAVGDGYTFGTCLVLQADGSLLIGGYFIDDLGYTHPIVFKVDANGNPVVGFGTSGLAMEPGTGNGYRITDMGVQSDGTIVYTASQLSTVTPGVGSVSSGGDFAAIQLYHLCSNNNIFNGLSVLDDDRVFITGYHGIDSVSTNFKALILKLNPDLSGDTTFSPGYICGLLNVETKGIEYYDSGNPDVFRNDAGNDIAELANGDIIVCGSSIDTANNADVYRTMLLRVHADNEPDEAFGLNGFRKPHVGTMFRKLVAQANGNLLALGAGFDGTLQLARFDANGDLDPGFGMMNGFTETVVGSFSTVPKAMTVQPDGRILVVGTAVNNNDDVTILRFNGAPVGIAEIDEGAGAVQVFPNPTTHQFTIGLPLHARQVTVTNALGQVVSTQGMNGTRALEMEVNEAGTYFIQVESAGGLVVRKLIVL